MTLAEEAQREAKRVGRHRRMGTSVPKQESADFLAAVIEGLQDSLTALLEEIEDEEEGS